MSDEIDPVAVNEEYREYRRQLQQLRTRVHDTDFNEVARFSLRKLAQLLRTHNTHIQGDLVVFVANDLGMPVACRPAGVPKERQSEIRLEILEQKYKSDDQLNSIRKELTSNVRIHKALVGVVGDEEIRYHLPGASAGETNFLTVREGLGLVDFCTNASQDNCIEY